MPPYHTNLSYCRSCTCPGFTPQSSDAPCELCEHHPAWHLPPLALSPEQVRTAIAADGVTLEACKQDGCACPLWVDQEGSIGSETQASCALCGHRKGWHKAKCAGSEVSACTVPRAARGEARAAGGADLRMRLWKTAQDNNCTVTGPLTVTWASKCGTSSSGSGAPPPPTFNNSTRHGLAPLTSAAPNSSSPTKMKGKEKAIAATIGVQEQLHAKTFAGRVGYPAPPLSVPYDWYEANTAPAARLGLWVSPSPSALHPVIPGGKIRFRIRLDTPGSTKPPTSLAVAFVGNSSVAAGSKRDSHDFLAVYHSFKPTRDSGRYEGTVTVPEVTNCECDGSGGPLPGSFAAKGAVVSYKFEVQVTREGLFKKEKIVM